MHPAWWVDLASAISFVLALAACWLLLSQKGSALIFTRQWIPPFISLVALALAALHLTWQR